jgi:GNAT superfamily N-acetyltransferase
MKTYILQELNEGNAARIDSLLHMLSPDAPAIGPARLSELLAGDSFWLFVTEDADGQLAGMLTLTRCHTLSRSKFWIEDVIVDPAYRGQGVGRALVHAAVEYVKSSESNPSLYLTSNPKRTAARALYRSEGFEEYETGVFRIV